MADKKETASTQPSQEVQQTEEHKSVWKVISQRAFLTVFVGNILVCISFNMVNAGMVVHFTEDYGMNAAVVGTVVGLFSFLSLIMKPISAPIIDRFNRKMLLVLSYLILAAGTAGLAFASDVTSMFVWQTIRGIGWGASMGLNAVILADVVGKADYGVATGLFMLGPVVGSSAVAPTAIPIADALTFTGLFLVAAAVALVDALWTMTLPYKWHRPEPEETGEKTKKSFNISSFIDWASIPYMLISAVASLSVIGMGTTIMLAFGRTDLGIANIGIVVTVHNVIMYFTRPIFGRIIDKRGARWGLIPGFLSIGVANLITAASTDMIGLTIAAVIYGIGGGGLIGSRTMAIKGAPADRMGVAGNTYLMGSDLGQTFGPVIFTSVFAVLGAYRFAYVAFGIIPIICIVIFALWVKFYLLKRHPQNEMGW